MNIKKIAKNVHKKKDGIFYSKEVSDISCLENEQEYCLRNEDDSFWYKHRNNIIVNAVQKYNNKQCLFDIGGGNGYVSKGLQETGMEVVLVEPVKEGARKAISRNINHVICATLECAGFEHTSLASIGLFDVLDHIERDNGYLKKIYTYLKSDGLLYITVPAYGFLWSNKDTDTGHYRRYTLKSIEKKVMDAGFTIQYSTYIFSFLFLFHLLPSLLGIQKKSSDVQNNGYQTNNKLLNGIMQKIWNWELNMIETSKKIPFGSSCFIVATKL